MSVLPAVRKRKARRILESRRGTVDDLRHQRKRLQRARPELFEQQKGRKVADIALVGEREHRAEPSLVHVRLTDIVMRRRALRTGFLSRAEVVRLISVEIPGIVESRRLPDAFGVER